MAAEPDSKKKVLTVGLGTATTKSLKTLLAKLAKRQRSKGPHVNHVGWQLD